MYNSFFFSLISIESSSAVSSRVEGIYLKKSYFLIINLVLLLQFGQNPVSASKVDASKYGNGFNAIGATVALQGAIDSKADTVFVPNMGTDWIEDLRAAEFLSIQPEVDPKRICTMGLSVGGFRTWQVAALSDHIAAGISVFWMSTHNVLNPREQPN